MHKFRAKNKKVLCERKRHTARCIASTRYAVLIGGIPHPVLARWYPIPVLSSGRGVSTPVLVGGIPHPVLHWGWEYPIAVLAGGIPPGTWVPPSSGTGWDIPLSRTGWGIPQKGHGTIGSIMGWGTP